MKKLLLSLALVTTSQMASAASYTITLINETLEPMQVRVSTSYTATKGGLFCKSFSMENGGFIPDSYNIKQKTQLDQQGRIAFSVAENIDKCDARRNSEPSLELKLSNTLFDDEAKVKTHAGGIQIVQNDSVDENLAQNVECSNVQISSGERVISCSGASIKFGKTGNALVNLVIKDQ